MLSMVSRLGERIQQGINQVSKIEDPTPTFPPSWIEKHVGPYVKWSTM
jgi:hypothetical protein